MPSLKSYLFRSLALAVPALVLSGCATMSEKDCQRANWRSQGLSDGRSGTEPQRIAAHREACAKVGVMPDELQWRTGYEEGIRSYCSPDSAWSRGLRNESYYGACANLDEGSFLRYHRAGQVVWKARQELTQNQTAIRNLEDQIRKATKDDERNRLREQLGRAERERNRLTAMIVTLELAGPPR